MKLQLGQVDWLVAGHAAAGPAPQDWLEQRAVEDERLTARIREIHQANYECYGYRRMHHVLARDGEQVGRDRVAKLMQRAGIRGAKRRGKRWRTTVADPAASRPPDLVKRQFSALAPDRLWVCDFTYLRSWEGKAYFSFVIDVFSRYYLVGWQFATNMHTDLVLDALQMAVGLRQPGANVLICHSDAGNTPPPTTVTHSPATPSSSRSGPSRTHTTTRWPSRLSTRSKPS